MNWKSAARLCLHSMGGLSIVRRLRRREFRILMFHAFGPGDAANVEAICSHIASRFEPVTMSGIAEVIESGRELPDNALTVTIDDGYRNYLNYAHGIFRRHRIPVTMYSVADFAEGRIWLWTDQIAYCLKNTPKRALRVEVEGRPLDLDLAGTNERISAVERVWEALKVVPDRERLSFLERVGEWTSVAIPDAPPAEYAAMNWDELKAAAADGVEIGCHTRTHPILSRIDGSQLDAEIASAKRLMEERLGFAVNHFCYPNGRDIDIGRAAVGCVRGAGFRTAVTTTWGLNGIATDAMLLRRVPLEAGIAPPYAYELLAGLHMPGAGTVGGDGEPLAA